MLSCCLHAMLPCCLHAICLHAMLSYCLYAMLPCCLHAMLSCYLHAMVPCCLHAMVPCCLYAMVSASGPSAGQLGYPHVHAHVHAFAWLSAHAHACRRTCVHLSAHTCAWTGTAHSSAPNVCVRVHTTRGLGRYDFVRVYDGPTSAAPSIAAYTGTQLLAGAIVARSGRAGIRQKKTFPASNRRAATVLSPIWAVSCFVLPSTACFFLLAFRSD